LIVYLINWNFDEYYYRKFEIDHLIKSGMEVQIISIGHLFYKKHKKLDQSDFTNIKVFSPNSLFSLLKYINFIKASNAKFLLVSYVHNTSFKRLFINLFLKVRKIKYIFIFNHGLPSGEEVNSPEIQTSLFLKIKNFAVKLYRKDIYFLYIYSRFTIPIVSFLSNFLSLKPSFLLVSGAHHIKKYQQSSNIKIIPFNSFDYSNHLLNLSSASSKNKDLKRIICYLDGAQPFFSGDNYILGIKNHLTVDKWYPALCKFFKKIEEDYNATVVICGHPQTSFERYSDVFEKREVVYGRTNEIIEKSILTVTRGSTAVSFALINKIPILGIISDEMIATKVDITSNVIFNAINCKVLNIDHFDISNANLLEFNNDKYEAYITNFMTADNGFRPNYKIISKLYLNI